MLERGNDHSVVQFSYCHFYPARDRKSGPIEHSIVRNGDVVGCSIKMEHCSRAQRHGFFGPIRRSMQGSLMILGLILDATTSAFVHRPEGL